MVQKPVVLHRVLERPLFYKLLESTQPVLIHHSCLHTTSCYSSQRYPRNQLLFITAVSTQAVLIHHSCLHATSSYSQLGALGDAGLLESTQYALFPEWEAPCYEDMRFFPSENAVTTSCLHEGDVEGFIEDLRKIIKIIYNINFL